MKNCKAQLAMTVLTLGLAAQAQSAIFTEYASAGPTTSTSLSVPFANFDASLGTLNSVELILTPAVTIGYDVFNASGSSVPAIYAEVSNPTVGLGNSGLGLGGVWSSMQDFKSGSFTANPGFNAGPVLPFNFGILPSSTTLGPAGFTGPGNSDLILTGSATETYGGSSGDALFYGAYVDYGASLEVEFNYTAAPESTWMTKSAGFAALGMLGLASIRRKFLTLVRF